MNLVGNIQLNLEGSLAAKMETHCILASKEVSLFQSNGNINSYVNEYVPACPGGYTQHPAIIDQDCLVNYCVEADSFSEHGEMPIVLPPFRSFHSLFVETLPKLGPEPPDGSHGMSSSGITIFVIGSILFIAAIIFEIWRFKVKRSRESLAEDYIPLRNNEIEEEDVRTPLNLCG